MQDLIATASVVRTPSPSRLHLSLTLLCVVAADWLFFPYMPGASAALFLVVVTSASVLGCGSMAREADLRAALIVPAAAVPALLENVGLLSLTFAGLGVVTVALAHRVVWYRETGRWLALAAAYPIATVADMACDIGSLWRTVAAGGRRPGFRREFKDWLLPGGMSLVFALLFATANPVFADWTASLLPSLRVDAVDVVRGLFWLTVFIACRPIVAGFRWLDMVRRVDAASGPARLPAPPVLASPRAVTRSLVAFNALFAVETALDAAYLVGGAALPAGMTYAEYAHRGAYPLVAAAMLAALFTVVAIRPVSDTARDPQVRRLVYCWIAQTALLLGSSAFRLYLYVSAYSLTYWRVAAFVWMAIVGFGLLFIVLRFVLDRSNGWLVHANILSVLTVLHGCCFVDIGGQIASFNVEHAIRGERPVDIAYLRRIGPAAVPALDIYAGNASLPRALRLAAAEASSRLRGRVLSRSGNWRSFTLRSRRLARYIAENPVDPSLLEQINRPGGIQSPRTER